MSDAMAVEPTTPRQTAGYSQTGLPRRRFVAMLGALGGIQLLAMMDGTVAIFALPKIQNELGLSDATRNWVITAYVLTSGGLILLGGRVGDTFGHKRTLIVGTALFTLTSAMCGIAWDGGVLVSARLLKGVAAAIVSPTAMALLATTFPKGPARNTAMAVFGAMASIGAVVGMVAGGLLAEVSWRMAFLVNVPIGVLAIYLTRTALRETGTARMKLDAAGAVLATLACTAAVFAFSRGPEHGWLSPITLGSGLVAVAASVAFVLVERNAENPIVPFSLFSDRDRTATFLTTFLAGGMTFTMAVLIALYVQNIMGYGPMRAAISFIPFSIATAIAVSASVRLVTWLPPRMMVIAGGVLLLGAMLYGSTLHRGIPYFPNLVAPIFVAGIGLGMINVAIGLALIASVGPEHIGPASAISMVLRSLGGPLMLAVIQGVITSRTLRLGGTQGPVKSMNDTQLRALDHGYAYGYLWLSGAVILIGGAALLIRYTAQQVAHAQEVNVAINAGEP